MTMVPDRVRVCGVAGCDQATRTLARDGDEPPNSTLNLEPPHYLEFSSAGEASA